MSVSNVICTNIFFILIIGASACMQQGGASADNDVVIGHSFILSSEILGEEREITVSLPASYESSAQHYPVLYMLHGDFYFKYGVAYTERLAAQGNIPELITVGISHGPNDNPLLVHDTPDADKFLLFFEREVLPFIESKFRTLEHRTISGWHHSASFTLHTLLNKPALFDGFIAASIFPLRINDVDLTNLSEFLAADTVGEHIFYFGSDNLEVSIAEATQELGALLDTSAPEKLNWHLNQLASDSDITDTVYRLLHPGLREVFRDFKMPVFDDLVSFNALGGMPFIEEFLVQREAKYGTLTSSNTHIIFSILRIALNANDLDLFEEAISKTAITTEGWNVYWYLQYARFFQSHEKSAEAIDLYRKLSAIYPTNIDIYIGLSEAYTEHSQKVLALERAIGLAEAQSDVRLHELRHTLNAIKR